jgi:hypothetical protein
MITGQRALDAVAAAGELQRDLDISGAPLA